MLGLARAAMGGYMSMPPMGLTSSSWVLTRKAMEPWVYGIARAREVS